MVMNPLSMLSVRERISRIMVLLRQKMDMDIDLLFAISSEEDSDSGPILAGCLSALEANRTMLTIILSFFHSYVEGDDDCEDVLRDIARIWEDDTSSTLMRTMSESEVSAGLLRVMRDYWEDNPVC
jgi:hypothetical protein